MIYLDKVSFGYREDRPLFEKLTLTLGPGHIYGLLGKNGAGKSSLLRIIAGLLFPSEGQIRVAGFDPSERLPAFLQDIFFIPEEIWLPSLPVDRFLSLRAPFYPRFDQEQFRGYLSEFEISPRHRLTDLSFGQRKKVLIAFALAANTKVLLMDEPTNGLDIPSKKQFRKIVSAALDSDKLLLISTHQVRDLDHLIDGIVLLENNEVLIRHSLGTVAERLYFGISSSSDASSDTLYSETSLHGYRAVTENNGKGDSRVDLEQLFHAAMENPERIRQIFRDV